MFSKAKFFPAIIVFCFQSIFLFAQTEDEDVTKQLWLDYNVKYYFAGKMAVAADLGARTLSPQTWARYYFRPELTYTKSPFTNPKRKITTTWHLGTGGFYTNNVDTTNQIEIRPFQGYNIQWPNFKRVRLRHYFRLEERFEKYIDDDSWQFDLTGRYQISAIISWEEHLVGFLSGLFIPLRAEFFFNLDQTSTASDLMRLTPGIGYHINADWRVEFYTSYHRVRNTEGGGFETNDIVFRFRVYQDIL